jgi:hypothetical protein
LIYFFIVHNIKLDVKNLDNIINNNKKQTDMDTQKNHYDPDNNPEGYSVEENRGWFGDDKVTVHYDKNGNSAGFSREENQGWLGDDNVKSHYDESGNKTGYSREEDKGWFGNDRVTTHYDKSGHEKGYTRTEDKNTFFGSSKTEDVHYDSDHNPTGTTATEEKGGCFLTTACVNSQGLDDNCYQLETLRSYRDNYLVHRNDGKADIDKYYSQAPRLVVIINSRSDSSIIWQETFNTINKIVKLIESKQYDQTYKEYKKLFVKLSNK